MHSSFVFKYAKLKAAVAFSLALLFVSYVNAATLTVPDAFVVKEIDGKKVSKGFFSKETKIDLIKGEHVLVLFYEDLFEELEFGFGGSTTVKSEPFVIKFILDKQQSLQLISPTIKNQKSAQLYAKSPQVMIKDEKGKLLVLEYADFAEYKAVKDLKTMVALAQKSTPKIVEPKSVQLTPQQEPVLSPQSLSMLKFWWQKASNKEKEQFKQYIIAQ
jgi:uncharacterized protein YccT (UPF0319 family)